MPDENLIVATEASADLHAARALKELVPIVFVDRRVGHSKMSRRIFLEAVRKVWSIRFSGFR